MPTNAAPYRPAPRPSFPAAAGALGEKKQPFSVQQAPTPKPQALEHQALQQKMARVQQEKMAKPQKAQAQSRFWLDLHIDQAFEACLKLHWKLQQLYHDDKPEVEEYAVEMAIDRSSREERDDQAPAKPAKDAVIKTVPMGTDESSFIQGMPVGRNFVIAVVGKLHFQGSRQEVRSSWVRAATLKPSRDKRLGNLDPLNMPRLHCQSCRCSAYVPFAFSMNHADKMRCRHCGCKHDDHVVVERDKILKMREDRARERLGMVDVVRLPPEALEWDERECNLWFWTGSLVHPRFTEGEHRAATARTNGPQGGPDGPGGRKGRVSVVTPTTESRQKFHEVLWKVFLAQDWADKELVVVETYTHHHSSFFYRLAKTDSRLVYVKFQRPTKDDWSIGLKRNIGAHLASGEIIANFDDDDLYAPGYLSLMVSILENRMAQAVTLSSWFIYDQEGSTWGFCDPIAWGFAKGMDKNDLEVRRMVYGYGFSYVFRRRVGLEICYEDIDLGEDYGFLKEILRRKGESSVELFHDNFGICLHIQHGGNTSNSMLLRDVELAEARDLDVMELGLHLPEAEFGVIRKNSTYVPMNGALWSGKPPSARKRTVVAHLPDLRQELVTCAVNATAGQFLELLQETVIEARDMAVFRVPHYEGRQETVRDDEAVDVLGLRFLLNMQEAKEHLTSGGRCYEQWNSLLEEARQPMRMTDRVGLRTDELWLRYPEEGDQEAEDEYAGEEEEWMVITAVPQLTSAKKFFSTRNMIQVRLPRGAAVWVLRVVMMEDLPVQAKVKAERPGKGLVELSEHDPVPERIVLSEFTGRRNFYARFSKRENLILLKAMRDHFLQPKRQERLAELWAGAQEDENRYKVILCEYLGKEVYSPVLRRFGLPDDQPVPLAVGAQQSIGDDFEVTEQWLITELIMQNSVNIRAAEQLCLGFFVKAGMGEAAIKKRLFDLTVQWHGGMQAQAAEKQKEVSDEPDAQEHFEAPSLATTAFDFGNLEFMEESGDWFDKSSEILAAWDFDGDGFLNINEFRAKEGIVNGNHSIADEEFGNICATLSADPGQGLDLQAMMRAYYNGRESGLLEWEYQGTMTFLETRQKAVKMFECFGEDGHIPWERFLIYERVTTRSEEDVGAVYMRYRHLCEAMGADHEQGLHLLAFIILTASFGDVDSRLQNFMAWLAHRCSEDQAGERGEEAAGDPQADCGEGRGREEEQPERWWKDRPPEGDPEPREGEEGEGGRGAEGADGAAGGPERGEPGERRAWSEEGDAPGALAGGEAALEEGADGEPGVGGGAEGPAARGGGGAGGAA